MKNIVFVKNGKIKKVWIFKWLILKNQIINGFIFYGRIEILNFKILFINVN